MPPPDDDTRPHDRVFRENLPALYRLAYTLLRQREEAEDAVQDAWLRVAQASVAQAGDGRAARADAVRHPRGWMFRVLRNLCIDRLRARRTHLRIVGTDTDIDSLPAPPDEATALPGQGDSEADAAVALARTMAAMERMPRELAEILTLVVIEGMPYREAASVLEIPVGTVRSRLNRARRHLRAMLADEDSDPNDTARNGRPQ